MGVPEIEVGTVHDTIEIGIAQAIRLVRGATDAASIREPSIPIRAIHHAWDR